MRILFKVCCFIISISLFISCNKNTVTNINSAATDSFTVTVNNGYGSGKYKSGDMVHIFTNHYTTNQLFDNWSGDTMLLNAAGEWHTWFVMPSKNVSVTGSIKSIPVFNLKSEKIKGRDRLKPVYSYFPAGHKGIVYLLHGTGGNAVYLVNDYEFQQLIKELVSNNFGVIVTEAEEATTGVDANGDGKLRWAPLPQDSITNVDYANIKIITDTFYNRGVTNRSKPRYSVGMSNGGFFSTALSEMYSHTAAVSYCAPSALTIIQTTLTPIQFCMARFDDNPEVGPAGNATALSESDALKARTVCSKYFIKERCPIYPERFARRGDISAAQSVAVFNELRSKGYVDSNGYYTGTSSEQLKNDYLASPAGFAALNSLNPLQQYFVLTQIDLCVSNHQMYSDFNKATLQFLNAQCR